MKNKILYTLLIAFGANFAHGQSGGFFKVYDYKRGNNYFNSIEEKNGKYYAAGISRTNGRLSGFFVQTNLNGDLIFQKEISLDSLNTVETRTQGLCVGEHESVYMSGYNTYIDSNSAAGYWRYPMLAKLDSNGNLLWYKNFVDSNYVDVWMQRCKMLSNNRLLLIGEFHNPNFDTSGVLLYVVDTAGNLITQKRISPFFNDNFWNSGYNFLSDGRLLLSGYNNYWNQGKERRASVLIDSNLNIVWAKEYGPLTSLGNVTLGSSQEQNGYITTGGYINETISSWGGVAFLEKIRLSDGVSVKFKKMELADVSGIDDVHLRANGDLITMGYADDLDTNSSDILIMRMDSNWNILWQRRYTYPYRPGAALPNENISETIQLLDDGYLIAGFTRGTDSIPPTQDAFLMKIDTNGCWQSGCNLVGINTDLEWKSEIRIYPNPASELLHIENAQQQTLLRVYSMQGTLVYARELLAEKDEIQLSEFSPGVYILEFENKQGVRQQERLVVSR